MKWIHVREVDIPALGLGTARMTGKVCRVAVEHALGLGYRHIDTAQMYDNEEAVGAALSNSTVPRQDVFLVTKVMRGNLAYEDVLRSVEASTSRLGTYIDLLLIHAPSRTVSVKESLEAMEELQHSGRIDHIGVSNFSVSQLHEAIAAIESPILTNQVEYHPFRGQHELLECCIDHDIMLTAYSPLARQRVMGTDTLQQIGEKYGKSEAQVALRWLLQQPNVSAIPKAASSPHQEENIAIFDFELTDNEMQQIFDLQDGVIARLRDRFGR